MSRFSVTEKEHWKSRIENRLDKAIESLQAKDVTLMPAIRNKASLEAHKALGTAKMQAKIDSIRQQRQTLQTEQEQLEAAMYRHALGEEAVSQASYHNASRFSQLHRQTQARFEADLLAESAIGQEILKLRAEKEALLDTVWLATSSVQIRDLWSRVSQVLGDEATELQRRILDETAASE